MQGSITADGSSTVFPITQAVAEEFRRNAPDVRISVGVSGTGGGFKKFCAGETDLSDASRPIKESERAACKAGGVEFLELEVAIDGLSVVVNPKNTWIDCITTAELKRLWEPGAQKKISRWSQLRPGLPDRPISLFGPGTDSGTFDYFTAEINGEEGASRSDYTASENDDVLVQGVGGEQSSLGYFGFAYYEENASKLKVLGVDAGSGCVEPSRKTVLDGTYQPLARPLFLYVAKKAVARPEVKAFVDFYLESVGELVESVGYINVTPATLAREGAEWASFKA